jgi:hypothetical protein
VKERSGKMAREKIRIKKIDNITARQVTFSKRRRGIFKKADELSVLCDADVALIIFSATGKLFEFSSSRMRDILGRYSLHASNINKLMDPPSTHLRVFSISLTLFFFLWILNSLLFLPNPSLFIKPFSL